MRHAPVSATVQEGSQPAAQPARAVAARGGLDAHRSPLGAPGDPIGVRALQRAVGNAAVGRMLGVERRAVQRACCTGCAAGRGCADHEEQNEILGRGRRALGRSVAERAAARGTGSRTLARYAHTDCGQDDLEQHIWPADYIARRMVRKAIHALEANPIDPAVAALFPKYFMTSSPNRTTMLHVLDQVEVEFRDNDYKYECESDCDATDNGYTYSGLWGSLTSANIHICMPKFRTLPNDCLARTIVHEFTHRYAGTDDNGYCKSGCGLSQCPAELSADDALENADSYACFAYELWQTTLASD